MSASKVLNMSLRGNKAIWEAETFGEQMIDVTVGDLLDRQAEAAPDKEALVYATPFRSSSRAGPRARRKAPSSRTTARSTTPGSSPGARDLAPTTGC
jgi:hypothetical protein